MVRALARHARGRWFESNVAHTFSLLWTGVIHSDLERGFIRAEVTYYDDLIAYGSLANARQHGALRVEGKEYIVRDGDIINVRFNV